MEGYLIKEKGTSKVIARNGTPMGLFSVIQHMHLEERNDTRDGYVIEDTKVVSLEDINIDEKSPVKHVATYCLPLVSMMFCGQTNTNGHVRILLSPNLLVLNCFFLELSNRSFLL